MEKKFIGVILLAILAAFAGSCAYNGQSQTGVSIEHPDVDVVDYYGCPNSKRIKKLNLKKRR